jgi:hypothetical protein
LVCNLQKSKAHDFATANFNRHKVCSENMEISNKKTSVNLTHTGFNSFPSDNTDLKVHIFIAGWSSIPGTSLKNYFGNPD